jgi:hypothetical protein
VPGTLVQRLERAADQAGLPRHLDHRVPAPIGQGNVGVRLASICGDQKRAIGDRPVAAPGQAGHLMPTSHCLPSKFAPQPCGTAKNQQLHMVKSTRPTAMTAGLTPG